MTITDKYRKEFPITERNIIYFNHAGVAPTSRRVCEAVNNWFTLQARDGVDFDAWEDGAERCRARFAGLIGSDSEEVAFVRNTSHGLSLVAEGLSWRSGQRIIVTSDVEYPSNYHVWHHAARHRGLIVDEIEPLHGGANIEAVARALRPETRLVAVSSAQFSTGAVTDLKTLGELCRDRGILFCVDGIQTVGALPIDVRDLHIDFLSADSHKWMLGMMGMGAVYMRKDLAAAMRPVLVGWKSMINGWEFRLEDNTLLPDTTRFEEGSPAYGLIEGFDAALALIQEATPEAIADHIRALCNRLAEGLEALGCVVSPPPELRHHIVCFSHPNKPSNEIDQALKQRGIVVADRGGRVRASPHLYNTHTEVDQFLDAVKEIIG
ncbi:MAG: aminotransferase class V-fold PLP-dependent enzyme [Acidobacteriota bacterium]|nr:aminotransferase class V-fold PLP-dependent enzyme [Acidobacteriota bacterium]